jgi:hypothetical protein
MAIDNFTMIAHSEDCYISEFPSNKKRIRTWLGWYNTTGWYSGAIPGTCDGKDDDSDRERNVVFSAYKNGSTLTNSTASICRPSFRIQQRTVTVDQSGSLMSVGHSTSFNIPNHLTSLEVFEAVRSAVYQVVPRTLREESLSGSNWDYIDSFSQLISELGSFENVEDQLVSDVLVRGAQKIFKGVAAQLAKHYFLTPTPIGSSAGFEGIVESKQQKLFLRSLFLRLIESVLCALTILCMYLALRPRRHTTPQDPASIARLSSIISRSQSFGSAVSSTASLSSKSLKRSLTGRYGTVFLRNALATDTKSPPQFVIKSPLVDIAKPTSLNTKYWQPLSTSWYFRLALLAVPLALIVALEITFQQSQRSNGLLDVTTNKWTHYGYAFIPALGE